jgi:hypothetical protein
VVIELDGGQHSTAEKYDEERSRLLESAGYVVLRFWNNDVMGNLEGVLEVVFRTLCSGGVHEDFLWGGGVHHPHPNPPLEGEGIEEVPLEGEGISAEGRN